MAKMAKSDVVYPSSSQTHAELGMYESVKSVLSRKIALQIVKKGGEKVLPEELRFDAGGRLVADALAARNKFISTAVDKAKHGKKFDAKKAAKTVKVKDQDLEKYHDLYEKKKSEFDAYWKVGLVGDNLVLRVKVKNRAYKGIFGYEEKDAVVLKGVQLVPKKKGSVKTDMFKPASFIVLDQRDFGSAISKMVDLSQPLSYRVAVEVPGSAKSPAMLALIKLEHEKMCSELREEAENIMKRLSNLLSKNLLNKTLGTTGKQSDKAVKWAQDKLNKLMDNSALQKEFSDRIGKIVESKKELKEHYLEWKIKCAAKAVGGVLNVVTHSAKLVGSAGADVTAYLSIAKQGLDFYTLIEDFRKKEDKAASELTESINLYKLSADDYIETVEAIYEERSLGASSTFAKVKAVKETAVRAFTVASNKIDSKLPDKLKGEPDPQKKYIRYLASLGKVYTNLESLYKNLDKDISNFKNSSIERAAKVWLPLQNLKKSAGIALVAFKNKQDFATAAKNDIIAAGVKLDDSTSLEKLRKFREGVKNMNISQIVENKEEVKNQAQNVKDAFDAVKKAVSAVRAVV